MSTYNICFRGKIRKISILLDWKKSIVSRAMVPVVEETNTPQPLYNTVVGVHNINRVS